MKRKVLAWLLAMCMVLTMIPMISFAASTEAPELPTATVTEIENENLTFAMNFEADLVSEEQLAYYGNWYADFELTVNKDVTFNANGEKDGFLSGQYDAWGENWVNVPPSDVTLKANETLKIMDYAAKLMNQSGLQLTYNDVYTSVNDFDCGVFFTPGFLEANPDLEVTLELRMYNPEDESESYVIGETYTFPKAPERPTATVTDIENDDLTFALNFKADPVTDEQLAYYGKWYADFELTVNKDVTFNANGGADGYLSGQYDEWSKNWVNVPFENVELKAGKSLRIMEYAAKQLGEPGLKYTYEEVYETVKDFDCGVFFTQDFLAANPDLKVTLALKMYDPSDESKSYIIGKKYTFPKGPALPTATVTDIENDDLTFALNFKADPATDEQLAYYGKWYADFELTVNKKVIFNANGGADGYLSGQYDGWSRDWVSVPFEDVTLRANKPLKIMDYAAKMSGQSGLQLTYNDVYTFVNDFDCGVFFTPEFLADNPDLKVTLELKMYNPEDATDNYVIGKTYTFPKVPELPTATTKNIENDDLTFAMNFSADEPTDEQLAYYDKWYADFELTVNKNVTFNANGGANGYLSGQYDGWSKNWVNVPFKNVTLNADEPLKIMAYAAEQLGEPGLKYTYGEVYEAVKDFDCGIYFTPEFLKANPGLEVTLELKMYNNNDESENYVIGETYKFCPVALNENTEKVYCDVTDALDAANSTNTVTMLADYDKETFVRVPSGVTYDLNGRSVKATDFLSYGNVIDTAEIAGGLEISNDRTQAFTQLQPNNRYLPIYDTNTGAYKFFAYELKARTAKDTDDEGHMITRIQLDDQAYKVLAETADSGLTLGTLINWKGLPAPVDYTFEENVVKDYAQKEYDSQQNKVITLNIYGLSKLDAGTKLLLNPYVKTDCGVVTSIGDFEI